jgi:hypothetical protein
MQGGTRTHHLQEDNTQVIISITKGLKTQRDLQLVWGNADNSVQQIAFIAVLGISQSSLIRENAPSF